MKITIKKEETIELDIQFPLFKQHGSCVYKIVSEDDWIAVGIEALFNETSLRIFTKKPCWYGNVLADGKDITEQEFNTVFLEVLDLAKSKSPLAEYEPSENKPEITSHDFYQDFEKKLRTMQSNCERLETILKHFNEII